ncbi:MAG: PQQ-binding-like beta-propeller repeat protein [Planctomycetia bacterium]|nr:PQQ-binding-like beta-propeller repeat protein [Planctomycetia bacterium]
MKRPPWICALVAAAVLTAGHWLPGERPTTTAWAEPPATPRDAAWFLRDSGVTGGLLVHVGCGAGQQTIALRTNSGCLVHGLDASEVNVTAARKLVAKKKLSGAVSIDRLSGEALPYIDNLVNLLIDESGSVKPEEATRVLVPGGVAYLLRDSQWNKTVKPVPRDTDEWTHFLHGPGNNPVAADAVVDNPRYLQWINGPLHARSHEHFQTVSALVSTGGRIFTILDDGPTTTVALPAEINLIARDAYNGVELWRKPIKNWEPQLRSFRGGPAWIERRLVAVKDRVYVTLGYDQPVTALNAATGEVLITYAGTEQASEIICDRGVLYVVISDPEAQEAAAKARRRGQELPVANQRLMAISAESGKLLWSREDVAQQIMPTTLAVQDGSVYLQNAKAVVCLHADTGKTNWSQPRATSGKIFPDMPGTLVVYEDVVLSADPTAPAPPADPDEVKPTRDNQMPDNPGELLALSAADGKPLWRARCFPSFHSPVDVIVADGVVWTGQLSSVVNMGVTSARDLHTGKVVRKRAPDNPNKIIVSHHRCHRIRATDRFLVLSRAGIDLLDIKSGQMSLNHWVRGTCGLGPLPCNGLLYAPSHACSCYPEAMLHGFAALASTRTAAPNPGPKLEQGPAFAAAVVAQAPRAASEDWATYRGNAARSGVTSAAVPSTLAVQWQQKIGGKLSAPTVSDGKVFVSAIDAHTVYALDADSGKTAWTYTAGGSVDSPPTIADGRALFGCGDGCVYCLRASDGELIWRFRATEQNQMLVAFGALESVAPIHGSVLVRDGSVYFAAGRSTYLDGGLLVYRLDAATGKQLSREQLDSRDPATGLEPDAINGFDMPGMHNDVMAADDKHLFMGQNVFTPAGKPLPELVPHMFSPTGFLDTSWWHRTYWLIGPQMYGGFKDWAKASDEVPHARMFCMGDQTVIGFGRTKAARWASHVGIEDTHHELYAIKATPDDWKAWTNPPVPEKSTVRFRWNRTLPILARALLQADQTLFAAGPPDLLQEHQAEGSAALAGKRNGTLQAISAADGHTVASYPIESPPVFDGLAAAGGRLLMCTLDGNVICYGAGMAMSAPKDAE